MLSVNVHSPVGSISHGELTARSIRIHPWTHTSVLVFCARYVLRQLSSLCYSLVVTFFPSILRRSGIMFYLTRQNIKKNNPNCYNTPEKRAHSHPTRNNHLSGNWKVSFCLSSLNYRNVLKLSCEKPKSKVFFSTTVTSCYQSGNYRYKSTACTIILTSNMWTTLWNGCNEQHCSWRPAILTTLQISLGENFEVFNGENFEVFQWK